MESNVDFFYHATGDDEEALKRMVSIIKDGAIYSRRLQNLDGGMFNGEDYISVAAWDDSVEPNSSDYFMRSSFPGFIMGLPCFILSSDLPAIKCEVRHDSYDATVERCSQYVDEWHVKDQIPISKVVGVALPVEDGFFEDESECIREILYYANANNWEVFTSDRDLVNNVRERMNSKRK